MEPVFNDQDTLTIFLGGAPVFTTNFQFGMPYTQISVSVPAQPGSQVLDFQFTPGSGPIFFDDAGLVAVAAAPTPTPGSVLGSAAAGAVIGLNGARIQNVLAKINGDEYSFPGRFAGQPASQHDQWQRLRNLERANIPGAAGSREG